MFKKLKGIMIFAVVLVGGVALVMGVLPQLLKEKVEIPPGSKQGTEQEALPVPVRVFKVAKIEFTDMLPTVGTIRGQTELELKFEISGIVKEIKFREGDLVQKGQVLVLLDDKDAQGRLAYNQAKVRAAEAQMALAEKRVTINQSLLDIGAIIKTKLEEAQLEAQQARAQVDTAKQELALSQLELEKTVLKAPMEGVMGTREAEPGEFVSPQLIIAALMDVSSVNVELGVIEKDIEKIRMGQRVKISVDSLPNAAFQGTVDNLAPMVEGKSRTLTAKVKVANPQGQLLPGMFSRAEIAVYEKPDALVIPTSALKDNDGDGRFESVFAVDGELAKVRPIVIGYLTTDYAEIKNGLQEGDEVVSEARGNLKDGSKVSLIETEEAGITRVDIKMPGAEKEDE